jgi:hypothetical protein
MVVVVDVPDGDPCGAFVFTAELGGVEQLFGQDALVALGLAVWRGVNGLIL